MFPVLRCADKDLSLERPRVMGILNVTPDSFSDGGLYVDIESALQHAEQLVEAGADIIDIGGESTRPGAPDVGLDQELDRVIPVIKAVKDRLDVIVSVDTSKAGVIKEACEAGAGLINDVRALREPEALQAAVKSGLPVCLMHMQGEPRTMQKAPAYVNVVKEVGDFLSDRRDCCIEAGLSADRIVIDPGFGFGKNLKHNLTLIKHLHELSAIAPVLSGLSRKRMFAHILGDDSIDRVAASVTGALLCVQHGASIVRVHDVEHTVHALAVYESVESV